MPNVKKKNEPQSDERRAAKPAEPHPETTRERVGEHAAAKKPRLTLPFSPDRSTAEQLLRFLLFAALGALTASAELLFGVRPFGLGLAAAATLPLLPAVAVGAAAHCLLNGGTNYLVASGVQSSVVIAVMGVAGIACGWLAVRMLTGNK